MDYLNFARNSDAHMRGKRWGSRREGVDPVYDEPDWDAPHHQRADLLHATARCETCLYWYGLCGLDTRRVCRPEDRCEVYQQHPDHADETAQRAAEWKHEPQKRRAVTV